MSERPTADYFRHTPETAKEFAQNLRENSVEYVRFELPDLAVGRVLPQYDQRRTVRNRTRQREQTGADEQQRQQRKSGTAQQQSRHQLNSTS